MNYAQFRDKTCDFPVIGQGNLRDIADDLQVLRNQLRFWKKKGWVLRLRRGLYILNPKDRKIEPSRIFLANTLYAPSYVSLEYALGFYDLIPERVADLTSISSKKTALFSNEFGLFRYQHLQTKLFVGYRQIKDENGYPVLIAEPEKT